MTALELTEHELRLVRRGLKALRYELNKKARKSDFVPAEGSKDINEANLAAVEQLLARIGEEQKTMTHPKHVCFNCGYDIPPNEPEVQVDPEKVRQAAAKKKAVGIAKNSDLGIVRYAHVSPEACVDAQRKANAW